MGVEVKGAGDGVVIADRGCNDNCCCGNRNSGWGSGWGAVGGALVGGGFGAAAVSVWDKINDTKADIQKVESTVQEAKAGIYKDISDAARGVTQEIGGVAKDVAGVGREILNNRFTTERGLCDLGYNWLFNWNVAVVTSRMANRKSSASSRTLPKTPRLLASIE